MALSHAQVQANYRKRQKQKENLLSGLEGKTNVLVEHARLMAMKGDKLGKELASIDKDITLDTIVSYFVRNANYTEAI
jgi:hypothetical protein